MVGLMFVVGLSLLFFEVAAVVLRAGCRSEGGV